MSGNSDRYAQYRAQGPIIAQWSMQGSTLYVIGYDAAREILGDSKRFVKDVRNTLPVEQRGQHEAADDMYSLLYNNMLETDPPDHTRLRALVSKAFTNRNIQSLAPRIQEIADGLIDEFEDRGSADLVEVFAFPLPIIVICELLGISVDDRNKFRSWSHAFIGIQYDDSYVELMSEFLQYIGNLIALRRKYPGDDLISGLVYAEEDGQRLSEQELFSMIALLIVAGHETTVGLISNGMASLLQHPDQAALLLREPALIDTAVEEFLRYDSPVEMTTMRYAAEDTTVGDISIRRGTPIVVVLGAVNHDPDIFDDASALDVTRKPNKHMGFGYGIHYCVGAPLARLEAQIAFNTLLRRLPTMRLAISPAQLRYTESAVVRGLTMLPVRWDTESITGRISNPAA